MTHEVLKIDPKAVLDANHDLTQRIASEGLFLHYDEGVDILTLEIGGPKKAVNEYVTDDLMVRLQLGTWKVVALEIMECYNDFLPHNRLFAEMMETVGVRRGKDCDGTIIAPRGKRQPKIDQSLREWFISLFQYSLHRYAMLARAA